MLQKFGEKSERNVYQKINIERHDLNFSFVSLILLKFP